MVQNPFRKPGPLEAEASAERIRQLNEVIISASQRAGLASLDLYEKTLKSIADMHQSIGEASQLQWLSQIATAQANFTREMAETYSSAARDFWKP